MKAILSSSKIFNKKQKIGFSLEMPLGVIMSKKNNKKNSARKNYKIEALERDGAKALPAAARIWKHASLFPHRSPCR